MALRQQPGWFRRFRERLGAAPAAWAILNGESTTGVTIFRLNELLDAGEILSEQTVVIEPGEDAQALTTRLAHLSAGALLRTLETMAGDDGLVAAGGARAELFIRPGYKFRTAGAFCTNLHVPDSAPLYMTAAFAGRELLFEAYSKAVEEKYRFYSYGDAMLIL